MGSVAAAVVYQTPPSLQDTRQFDPVRRGDGAVLRAGRYCRCRTTRSVSDDPERIDNFLRAELSGDASDTARRAQGYWSSDRRWAETGGGLGIHDDSAECGSIHIPHRRGPEAVAIRGKDLGCDHHG